MFMFYFVIGLLLAIVAVVLWVLRAAYEHIPQRELKRLARAGDPVADLLYRAAGYGASLQAMLGGGAVVLSALSLVAFASATNVWWAVLVVLMVLGVGAYILMPSDELTHTSLGLARVAAPGIAWLLERLHPPLNTLVRWGRSWRPARLHTRLYERDDLVRLLERQRSQPDSRIPDAEIDLLQHSLAFADLTVADALVPLRVVKSVSATDAVGPILMDELSRSGHSRFPVYDGRRENVVGVLHLRDLVSGKKPGRTVADVMRRDLTYVHEDFTLPRALQAFLSTRRHLFLVVNSFEELVGIMTIEDVLEQLIGKQIVDEFDRYDDLRAVAAAAAHKEHAAHRKAKEEPAEPPGSTPGT